MPLPFDAKLNQTLLLKLHHTPKEMQFKFSNPIRDYCHLLSNRLVILLIDLHDKFIKAQSLLTDFQASSEDISLVSELKNLRASMTAIVKHVKKQLLYQQELKFIKQSSQRMKTAERDVNRVIYAFEILTKAGFPMEKIPA